MTLRRFRVTTHDTRGGVDPVVTVESAPWIGAAAEPAWAIVDATVPRNERRHFTVSIETLTAEETR